MKLPDKLYDILKWIVLIVMPAVATLYALLSNVWGWVYADQIVTTINGLTVFLGAVLCISTAEYNKS